MAKITMFTCDCCKEEYKDEPLTGQTGGAEINLSGVGPVDRPMGKNINYALSDLCPKCLTQLRDGILRIMEARKNHLDATVNDSTKSPKTEQIEKAVAKGKAEERERHIRIFEDHLAGLDTIMAMREKEGDEEGVARAKRDKEVANTLLSETQKI